LLIEEEFYRSAAGATFSVVLQPLNAVNSDRFSGKNLRVYYETSNIPTFLGVTPCFATLFIVDTEWITHQFIRGV